MNVWVVIPAYNEEKNLKSLLLELTNKGLSVLVIDDGSKDNTFDIAQSCATVAIRNNKNLGKGGSLNKGISFLLANKKFDCIITMDADNQHSVSDIDGFLEVAIGGEALVVGNRMGNPQGMPKIRVCTNKFMSWLMSKIIGQYVPDTQCGFRLIKREILEKVTIETSKYEVESEILFKASKLGYNIKSIPIKSIYFKQNVSKINPLFDTIRFFRFILKIKK